MQIGGTLQEDRVEGEVEYFYGGLGASVFDDVPGTLTNPIRWWIRYEPDERQWGMDCLSD